MFLQITPGEDAAVHFRVQGLDATIEHFGEAGVVTHVGHIQTCIAQGFGGTAGGQEFDTKRSKLAGKFDDAGFIGNTQKGLGNFHDLT
ncbi:hypothetical protein GCM10027046_25480 [Uliginosibacterium flavum]